MPGKYDLQLYRGDSYGWTFRRWADDAHMIPTDLTGQEAAAQIRDKSGGAQVVDLTCVIALPNEINVTLDADMWTGAPTAGAWDLELTHTASGAVHTVLAGKVAITADITNSPPTLAAVSRRSA